MSQKGIKLINFLVDCCDLPGLEAKAVIKVLLKKAGPFDKTGQSHIHHVTRGRLVNNNNTHRVDNQKRIGIFWDLKIGKVGRDLNMQVKGIAMGKSNIVLFGICWISVNNHNLLTSLSLNHQ
jgi:hypothetical protein